MLARTRALNALQFCEKFEWFQSFFALFSSEITRSELADSTPTYPRSHLNSFTFVTRKGPLEVQLSCCRLPGVRLCSLRVNAQRVFILYYVQTRSLCVTITCPTPWSGS